MSNKVEKTSYAIGPRAVFGLACLKAKKIYSELTCFTADTHTSAGLKRYASQYNEDLIDSSIAEQSMIGVASGYALTGGTAIASTFAPFLTMRGYEMIRHCMGYMKSPLMITGLASGIVFGELGYTHCCIEDVGIISNIPNIEIYSPITPFQIYDIVDSFLENRRGIYLRLTGEPNMEPVNIRKALGNDLYEINYGKEIVVITNGSLTSEVQKALNILTPEEAKHIGIYGLTKIHPINLSLIYKELENAKKIILIDEGTEKGFASLFLLKYKEFANKLDIMAHPDHFLKPGCYEFMLKQAGIDSESIYRRLTKYLELVQD